MVVLGSCRFEVEWQEIDRHDRGTVRMGSTAYGNYYGGMLMQSRATKRGLVTLYSDLNVGVFPKHLIFAVMQQ